MSGARETALRALERCRRSGAWSDAVLDGLIHAEGLDRRDAALASKLCYGVQQNQYLLDFYIDCYASVKTKKLEPKVLDILRISVYQLLFLDRIPPRAAVAEGVSLCRKLGLSRASGLVNAVLRRVSENQEKLPELPGKGTASFLSLQYSHPLWLVQLYLEQYGYEQAELLLACSNAPAEVNLQVNTLKTDLASCAAETGAKSHPWLENCLTAEGLNQELQKLLAEGKLYVQDAAARLAVLAAAPQPGMKVLDACAAPGGKSFAAAIAMEGKGEILSCDLHEKKLGRIRTGAERLGLACLQTRAMDASKPHESLLEGFDLVFADVPCSGLGVIRKKPDIRWKDPAELERLPQVQARILEGISRCVRPGGVLLYSTCTIRKSENEDVAAAFLAQHPEFEAEAFTLPGPAGRAERGMLTLLPHIHGTDGFFICKFRRKI